MAKKKKAQKSTKVWVLTEECTSAHMDTGAESTDCRVVGVYTSRAKAKNTMLDSILDTLPLHHMTAADFEADPANYVNGQAAYFEYCGKEYVNSYYWRIESRALDH